MMPLGGFVFAQSEASESLNEGSVRIPTHLKWSERMILSEIQRVPDATLLDFRTTPRWSYTNGLVLCAAAAVFEQTQNPRIYEYIYGYANSMIDSLGNISTYKLTNQNLDMIKSGDVLLYLFAKTKEERFLNAMQMLDQQLESQPTTSDGGYWHKKIYPYQMWLDGLYMAEPFHAAYARDFVSGELQKQKIYDQIVHQFDLIEEHNRDTVSGLYFHGWDEQKVQQWANAATGTSSQFWSRGMGWYGMALVDVLDFLPENHEGRPRLIQYLNQFASAVISVQDSSGLWWQVLDQGGREGNYLEATGSAMFTYTLAKGVRKSYLDSNYLEVAQKAYKGMLSELITVESNGLVNLNKCCGVAGLGGNPYRDGTYEYYIGEIVRANDPKGTGPFILASLELDQ
jgi:unsaturated rhamnogalacturonyl hydrolase